MLLMRVRHELLCVYAALPGEYQRHNSVLQLCKQGRKRRMQSRLACAQVTTILGEEQGPVRICVPEKPDAPAVTACTAALNAVYSTPDVSFKCIGGETDDICLLRVSHRQDHLTLVA
eukprot:scaffold303676_cov18-Tisochrysis_lutea.AAC.1